MVLLGDFNMGRAELSRLGAGWGAGLSVVPVQGDAGTYRTNNGRSTAIDHIVANGAARHLLRPRPARVLTGPRMGLHMPLVSRFDYTASKVAAAPVAAAAARIDGRKVMAARADIATHNSFAALMEAEPDVPDAGPAPGGKLQLLAEQARAAADQGVAAGADVVAGLSAAFDGFVTAVHAACEQAGAKIMPKKASAPRQFTHSTRTKELLAERGERQEQLAQAQRAEAWARGNTKGVLAAAAAAPQQQAGAAAQQGAAAAQAAADAARERLAAAIAAKEEAARAFAAAQSAAKQSMRWDERKRHQADVRRVLDAYGTEPRKMWRLLKQASGHGRAVAGVGTQPVMDSSGTLATEPAAIKSAWVAHATQLSRAEPGGVHDPDYDWKQALPGDASQNCQRQDEGDFSVEVPIKHQSRFEWLN